MLGKLTSMVKNIPGWKTNRKLMVISVDDFGNVRLASKEARGKLNKLGLKEHSHFDRLDALEDKFDLEMLFESLSSVKDKNDNPAVFTPFSVPCNINFEKIIENNFDQYYSETLVETYSKLEDYKGTWQLWKEGIEKGLLVPQFHGREHLNLKVFRFLLHKRDKELLACLRNRSYTSISSKPFSEIDYTAAYQFQEFNENEELKLNLQDGLLKFEKVFGCKSIHFMPPTANIHPSHYNLLSEKGIVFLDSARMPKIHEGGGKYSKEYRYTGMRNKNGQRYLIRNCVFEPSTNPDLAVQNCLNQIESAFYTRNPAVISSHRVNFSGHIEESNREKSNNALKLLLANVVQRWPEVEFISSKRLYEIMEGIER